MKRPRTLLPSLPLSLVLLLLAQSSPLVALSAHSPQDLEAFPKYNVVVLAEDQVLNDTVPYILQDFREALATDPDPPSNPAALHLLRTPAGQAFLCEVPPTTDEAAARGREQDASDSLVKEADRARGLERGLELLEPMRGSCLFLKQNWFTYKACYGFEIRQFHEVRVAGSNIPEEDPHNDAYTLGQFPVPVAREAPKYGSGSSSLATKDAKIPATLGGGSDVGFGWDDGGRYLSQTWDDGTLCDKTGMPRLTEVQYHCNTQSIDRIALIRETAICRYVMIIHTPRLCNEAVFLEGHDTSHAPASAIECRPVVKKLRETVDPPQPPMPPPPPHIELEPEAIATDPLPGIMDNPVDVVTLVYDPATGAIESAVTENGEDVFAESALRKRLLGEEGDPLDAEVVTDYAQLQDLAKMMRETIADALRGHSGSRDADETDENAASAPERKDTNVKGLSELLHAINDALAASNSAAPEDDSATSDGKTKSKGKLMHPGLHAYLSNFEKTKKVVEIARDALLGSEEHAELAKSVGRSYSEDEHEQEKEEEPQPRKEKNRHDEL